MKVNDTNSPIGGTFEPADMTGGGMDYIKTTDLQSKTTAGAVGTPSFGGYSQDIIGTKSADTTNSTTDLNQTYSQENRSAKFKYPNVQQDIPSEAKNQYES